jgi:hypothetical protein
MTISHVDPELKSYGSERQGQYVDAINAHGSQVAAAAALGVCESSVRDAMNRLKASAAMRGYAPEFSNRHPVPPTHVAKGVSTLYDQDGKVRAQWVKSVLNNEQQEEAIRAAAEAFAEELPRVPPVALRGLQTNQQLCNVFTMTDCHVGMLAWGKETGEPWDLDIAETTLSGCFTRMVKAAPWAKVAIVNQLGDFLHSDGMQAVTPTSGHLLDQDGRFAKVVKVAIRVLRRIIDEALLTHEQVVVILAEGNHDMASSIWLRAMFSALYENEPRVTINTSEYPYYAHQHGKTMLAFHHGHLSKKEALPLLFATAFPRIWGETTWRYCHTGHMHHKDEKEHAGMTVFQHTTLAARDAYSSRNGYLSTRSATAVTYHDQYGEVARNTVCPEMLDA